jgi:hypothetical protein
MLSLTPPSYANAAIGPALTIIKMVYPEAFTGTKNASLVSSMGFAGAVIGQLCAF